MMYVAIGEKNRDTIISSLQACFIIAHSSEGILFLRIYIYIYIYIYNIYIYNIYIYIYIL